MRTICASPRFSLSSKQALLSETCKKKRVLVIGGPTASGKSDLAFSLAQVLGGEIISADSCQVYSGMDIGTAKPSCEMQGLITHHLINICSLKTTYNVAQFYADARQSLREIAIRENVPIVVGGSGFYHRVFLYGTPLGPSSRKEIREQLEQQIATLGAEVLYERLQMLDPVYAATISEFDRHKIVRGLEIIAISEKKVSDFPKPSRLQEENFDFRCWFIYYPKEILYPRIEKRCEEMIEKGFLEEVRSLEKAGLRNNPTASQAIGYRQALKFLDSGQTKDDFKIFMEDFKKASRQFAKRQFTWFRKEPLFRWLNCAEYSPDKLKEIILQDFEQH